MGIKNFGLETPEYYNTALNRLPGPTRHWFTGFIDPLVKNYSALSSIRYYRLRLRGTISYYFLFCIRNCHMQFGPWLRPSCSDSFFGFRFPTEEGQEMFPLCKEMETSTRSTRCAPHISCNFAGGTRREKTYHTKWS